MEFHQTRLTRNESGVAVVTMDRPHVLNAYVPELIDEIESHLKALALDETVKTVVITGAGRAFCAGMDISNVSKGPRRARQSASGPSPAQLKVWTRETQGLARAVEAFHKPLIASINGDAIGGGMDIASMCDYRIASSRARFSLRHLKLGRVSYDGGYYFLARILPPARILDWAWSSRIISAEEAFAVGYVNMVVPPEDLDRKSLEFATQLAKGPTVAIELVKQIVYQTSRATLHESLQDAGMAGIICETTEDAREGVQAFLEKRKPDFKGR